MVGRRGGRVARIEGNHDDRKDGRDERTCGKNPIALLDGGWFWGRDGSLFEGCRFDGPIFDVLAKESRGKHQEKKGSFHILPIIDGGGEDCKDGWAGGCVEPCKAQQNGTCRH